MKRTRRGKRGEQEEVGRGRRERGTREKNTRDGVIRGRLLYPQPVFLELRVHGKYGNSASETSGDLRGTS
jgi:hypothetical protein